MGDQGSSPGRVPRGRRIDDHVREAGASQHRECLVTVVRKPRAIAELDRDPAARHARGKRLQLGDTQPKLAGLYAEGRIETQSRASLTLPATAIVREGDQASAWRVTGEKLQKVNVSVGERDPRSGDFVVRSGLREGDQVLRYPSAALKDGQPVQASAKPSSSSATAEATSGSVRN